jgi:hypothetical protein
VLAVIHCVPGRFVREGISAPAKECAPFQKQYFCALFDQINRCGQTGKASADD